MSDHAACPAVGFVTIRQGGAVLLKGPNAITTAFLEVLLRSLIESDFIKRIIFANTGGLLASSATTALPHVVGYADLPLTGEGKPVTAKDLNGLKSVGIFTAAWTPEADTAFDTIGLISSTGMLVAALPLQSTVAQASKPLEVEWQIALRGAASYQP